MRRSKHMAKKARGLKILKIIIILAITFLAGIVVTFCQKQSKPVVTDGNRTMQTTSNKSKKHKKAEVKKETGKETKDSVAIKSGSAEGSKNNEESTRVERAKVALDKYCRGEYITGQEAADLDWYCKKYRISPQPANDAILDNGDYVGQTKYDDQEPVDDNEDYSGNVDEPYNGDSNYGDNEQSQSISSDQQTAVENSQEVGNNNQGRGNYGNN